VPHDVQAAPSGRRLRYQDIRDQVRREIESSVYAPGERLASDSELGVRFGVSRLTVIRALRELESQSLVQRKAGSGTFVRAIESKPAAATRVFGLLMPDLGDGEIFEPVARGIAHAAEALHHRLLWGGAPATAQDKERQAEDLSQYLIERKVDGVFFAPVEHTPQQEAVNLRIERALTEAGIPIVLIDRCIARYPQRSRHDLVGIDNRRAGSRMTQHVLDAGARRVVFASRPGAAPTVQAREWGYRETLYSAHLEILPGVSVHVDQEDTDALRKFVSTVRPDAIVCANDLTAARLMHQLLRIGIRIPQDVRMVGINDVKYASFLPVPLTTLRQPCEALGASAMGAMLERVKNPSDPAHDILLDCELILRQSCGVPSAAAE
jgi:GntR family transcriptional regulator of arabinose operon